MTTPSVELRFNPTDLRPRDLPTFGAYLGRPSDAIEAGLSVARARMIAQMKAEVRGISEPTAAQLLQLADLAWGLFLPSYKKISAPVMADAYIRAFRHADAGDVPMNTIYALAEKHAEKTGDYFHASSRDALADGFNTMVNRRIPAKAAADKVLDAYGLTPRQMRGYTSNKQLVTPMDSPIPFDVKGRAREYLDKSFIGRVRGLSEQEEHNIEEQAKQFAWMWLQDKGRLTERAQKIWITAKDERVCKVCGPLHGQKVLVSEQFKTKEGDFWSPGVHPNCRCVVRLIENRFQLEKRFNEKDHPRDLRGVFSHAQVTVTSPKGDQIEVDRKMAKPLASLWSRGVETLYSCQGSEVLSAKHGDMIGGGYVFVRNNGKWQAMVSQLARDKKKYPKDLHPLIDDLHNASRVRSSYSEEKGWSEHWLRRTNSRWNEAYDPHDSMGRGRLINITFPTKDLKNFTRLLEYDPNVEKRFDPHQPRGKDGRWGGGQSRSRQLAHKLNAMESPSAKVLQGEVVHRSAQAAGYLTQPRYLTTPLKHRDREMGRLARGSSAWSRNSKNVQRTRELVAADDEYYAMKMNRTDRSLKHLIRAVQSAPANSPELYRGMVMHPEHLEALKAGTSITLPMSSFTNSQEFAESFSRKWGPMIAQAHAKREGKPKLGQMHPVVMVLEPKASALNISPVVSERQAEWITQGEFLVTKVADDKGLTVVHLRQVPKKQSTFVNELGNTISMNVVRDDRGVTVAASGPTSEVEHTWTPKEADKLRDLLSKAEGWEPKEHPRGGDPDNPGRFSRKQKTLVDTEVEAPPETEEAPVETAEPEAPARPRLGTVGRLGTVARAKLRLGTIPGVQAEQKLGTIPAPVEAPVATPLGTVAPVVAPVTAPVRTPLGTVAPTRTPLGTVAPAVAPPRSTIKNLTANADPHYTLWSGPDTDFYLSGQRFTQDIKLVRAKAAADRQAAVERWYRLKTGPYGKLPVTVSKGDHLKGRVDPDVFYDALNTVALEAKPYSTWESLSSGDSPIDVVWEDRVTGDKTIGSVTLAELMYQKNIDLSDFMNQVLVVKQAHDDPALTQWRGQDVDLTGGYVIEGNLPDIQDSGGKAMQVVEIRPYE